MSQSNRVFAVALFAVVGWLVGDVRAEVLPGDSTLIATLDYSDTYTLGTTDRPGATHYADPMDYPYYNVETAYHGLPTAQWGPGSPSVFSFNQGEVNTDFRYPGNTGNSGAASGLAQSGGGDWRLVYNSLRDDYIVQVDGIIFAVGHRLNIGSYASDFTSDLSVHFRRAGGADPQIGVYKSGSGETDTGFTTGIASTDQTWHNFAVRFNQAGNSLSFYVDEALKGTVDLTVFGGGTYQTYSSQAIGNGMDRLDWLDNFQVGSPIPEPGTLALLATGLVGLLCYAWRKRKCAPR